MGCSSSQPIADGQENVVRAGGKKRAEAFEVGIDELKPGKSPKAPKRLLELQKEDKENSAEERQAKLDAKMKAAEARREEATDALKSKLQEKHQKVETISKAAASNLSSTGDSGAGAGQDGKKKGKGKKKAKAAK